MLACKFLQKGPWHILALSVPITDVKAGIVANGGLWKSVWILTSPSDEQKSLQPGDPQLEHG